MKLTDEEVLEVLHEALAWHRGDKYRNGAPIEAAAWKSRETELLNFIHRQLPEVI